MCGQVLHCLFHCEDGLTGQDGRKTRTNFEYLKLLINILEELFNRLK